MVVCSAVMVVNICAEPGPSEISVFSAHCARTCTHRREIDCGAVNGFKPAE
jgi:hypothetical protein